MRSTSAESGNGRDRPRRCGVPTRARSLPATSSCARSPTAQPPLQGVDAEQPQQRVGDLPTGNGTLAAGAVDENSRNLDDIVSAVIEVDQRFAERDEASADPAARLAHDLRRFTCVD